jgi:hypothetical protein
MSTMNWTNTIEKYIAEGRTVSGAKGQDNTAASSEQSQAAFTRSLQNSFANNNAAQQSQLNFLNTKMQSTINNPQGYSPATLAALRTQGTDAVAAQNQNVERSANAMEATQGGAAALPSGVNAQINASDATQAAEANNAAQQNVTVQNANLEQSNYNNAVMGEESVAGQENPEGMATGANAGAGQIANLSQAVTSSDSTGTGAMLGSLAGSLGSAAIGAYCPAKGTLMLVADGIETPIEQLLVGGLLTGIDGELQTIEEIQSMLVDTIKVTTANGYLSVSSYSHAFALPVGGFTVASKSLGKVVNTQTGPSKVVSVEPFDKRFVYNVITDGSHTYRSNGVWSVGVGDAERQVSSAVWTRINHKLATQGVV